MPLVHAVLSVFVSHGKNSIEKNCSKYGIKSPWPPISCNVLHVKIIKTYANKWRALVVKKITYSLDEKRVLIRLIISNDKTYSLVNTWMVQYKPHRLRSSVHWTLTQVRTSTHTTQKENSQPWMHFLNSEQWVFLFTLPKPCSLLYEVVQFVSV